jgi:hypothetical protein
MICNKCKVDKPQNEFRPSFRTQCRKCVNNTRQAWRKRDGNRSKEVHEYRRTHPGANKEYAKRSYWKHRIEILQKKKEWRKRNPEKERANHAINHMIRRKGLTRPPNCMYCQREDVEGHHPDYAKPFYVFWLCRPHHKQIHHGTLQLPQAI